jgi:hypothetical protein
MEPTFERNLMSDIHNRSMQKSHVWNCLEHEYVCTEGSIDRAFDNIPFLTNLKGDWKASLDRETFLRL